MICSETCCEECRAWLPGVGFVLLVSAGGVLSALVSDAVSVLGRSVAKVTEETAGGKEFVVNRSMVMGGFRVPGWGRD